MCALLCSYNYCRFSRFGHSCFVLEVVAGSGNFQMLTVVSTQSDVVKTARTYQLAPISVVYSCTYATLHHGP